MEKGDGSSFTVATGGGPQKVGILEVISNNPCFFNSTGFSLLKSTFIVSHIWFVKKLFEVLKQKLFFCAQVVLDGYSAPLTAGNFADLVMYVCTFACFEKLNGMGWRTRKS